MNQSLTAAWQTDLLLYEIAEGRVHKNETAKRFIRRLFWRASRKYSELALEVEKAPGPAGLDV